METIDDIRRDDPGQGSVGGPPRTVTRFFGCQSTMKFAALAIFVVGIIVTCTGVFTLVFPVAMIGGAILLFGGLVWARAKCPD